jgi:hypothetical protein
MPKELAQEFERRFSLASSSLNEVSDAEAEKPFRPGGWTKKQILGHLIDSSINNHLRFVRAAVEGRYEGPSYQQQEWVRLNNYANLGWPEILRQWRTRNQLLVQLVRQIPEPALEAQCRIADEPALTLHALIVDYLDHLEHHIAQIMSGVAPGTVFLSHSIRKMEQMTAHVEDCLARLNEEQIWQRGAKHENTIGNLVLHLCGNIRQWMIHGIGGEADVRTRDAEFAAAGGISKSHLAAKLRDTVTGAIRILRGVMPEQLTEIVHPQDADITVLEAIYQVVGHFQQHTGQIILLTKHLSGEDLGLYRPPK